MIRQSLFAGLALLALQTSFAANQCVILLHGLARSHCAMSSMQHHLESQGYRVVNLNYPTTSKSIEALATEELPPMISACMAYHPNKIHFVTHSLGGIVLRQYLQTHSLPELGRIVMLSPPNHGSPLADLFQANWIYRATTGPAGQALSTSINSLPNRLPDAHRYHVGIIAGSHSPTGQWLFHENNDGKVSISSARLDGMNDFIVMPVSHTFMMANPEVIRQVLAFLHRGKFNTPA